MTDKPSYTLVDRRNAATKIVNYLNGNAIFTEVVVNALNAKLTPAVTLDELLKTRAFTADEINAIGDYMLLKPVILYKKASSGLSSNALSNHAHMVSLEAVAREAGITLPRAAQTPLDNMPTVG